MALISPFVSADVGTNIGGLINSDTVWTKTGSPYSFTGSVGISQGVTLTVEPGATVNLGSYYLRVNGTLTAKGTSSDKITFNGGQITLSSLSNGWSEQTQSGCIIQNAVLSQTTISASNAIKVDRSDIHGEISVASSILTNNVITGNINSQSSTITDNSVKGDIVLGTLSLGGMGGSVESSIVSRNTVEGTISSGSTENTPIISDNTVSKGGISCTGYCSVRNNYVHDCERGIGLYTLRVFGGWVSCYATVENNLVVDNVKGIVIDLRTGTGDNLPNIQANTISGNTIGISLEDRPARIQNNNIQNNTNYNFYLDTANGIDVSNNWWGTTDESAISQSIYDSKNNINMGTVTFKPILSAPNPDAPTAPPATSIPSPTATPTEMPAPSPTVPEFPTIAILAVMLAATSAALICRKKSTPSMIKIEK